MSSQSPGIGSALPDMNANTSAMVLTNDGVMASWEVVTSLGLPSQGGNSGKYLTTNGTAASWGAVTADGVLPSQTGNSGKVLTTNGTTASWGTVSGAGVDTMAAVGSSPSADGASIASTTLTLQPADLTHPGVVTAGDQEFGGNKRFSGASTTGTGVIVGYLAGTAPYVQWGSGAYMTYSAGNFVFNGSGSTSSWAFYTSQGLAVAINEAGGGRYFLDLSSSVGDVKLAYTDSTGTAGDATINKPSGISSIASGQTVCDITNSHATATSIACVTLMDLDTTATAIKAVCTSGHILVTANAAATANTKFSWVLFQTA